MRLTAVVLPVCQHLRPRPSWKMTTTRRSRGRKRAVDRSIFWQCVSSVKVTWCLDAHDIGWGSPSCEIEVSIAAVCNELQPATTTY